jgi:hypothetical protein
LPDAAVIRLICASNRIDTAIPAASSSGDTIFEPEDNLARDFASFTDDSESKRALLSADVFVLITIFDSFHESALAGSFVF